MFRRHCMVVPALLAILSVMSLTACVDKMPDASEADTEIAQDGIYTSPPELAVTVGGSSVTARRGGFSWSCNIDGHETAIEADSLPPLDESCREPAPVINGTDIYERVNLDFQLPPDEITVGSWSAEYWGNIGAEYEVVEVNGSSFGLNTGEQIYYITAVWDNDGGKYHGSSTYSVVISSE